jgi:hypothetical protein
MDELSFIYSFDLRGIEMNESFIVTLFTTLILTFPFNVLANPPEFETEQEAYDWFVAECDGFDLRASSVATWKHTLFFDDDSILVRSHHKGQEADFMFYRADNVGYESIYLCINKGVNRHLNIL